VTSAIDVQVFEDGQLIGSGDSPRMMLPAGAHELVIMNAASGYRAARTVNVLAGKVTPIAIDIPNGLLAINALPWAEAWLDGERIGPTPIGNFAATIGPHEVVFKHPSLGERRRTIVVPATGVARVSVDLNSR
jgi:hypothetical protein